MSASTHDYRRQRRCWGHDLSFEPVERTGGRKATATGWGSGIREGDYLILSNGDGETRYRVEAIKYTWDPPDMWFADLVFDPRTAEAAA